jgi:hypothetical protein
MRTTSQYNGRLCDEIIRNLAVSKIAEKNDLFVEYNSYEEMKQLGIDLFIGKQKYEKTIPLTDNNYFSIYDQKIRYNLNPNNDYFQTKEIIHILYKHIQSVKNTIIEKNPFKIRYQKNNDVCVDIRLTQFNPGAQYYLNTLSSLRFDRLYLSTDDPTHPIITQILQKYPRAIPFTSFRIAQVVDAESNRSNPFISARGAGILNENWYKLDEVQTIQFASTCKYVVLSYGSLSAVIGYLAFFSTVYYCKLDPTTLSYGDMFSITGWKEISPLLTQPQPFGKRFFFNMSK